MQRPQVQDRCRVITATFGQSTERKARETTSSDAYRISESKYRGPAFAFIKRGIAHIHSHPHTHPIGQSTGTSARSSADLGLAFLSSTTYLTADKTGQDRTGRGRHLRTEESKVVFWL